MTQIRIDKGEGPRFEVVATFTAGERTAKVTYPAPDIDDALAAAVMIAKEAIR